MKIFFPYSCRCSFHICLCSCIGLFSTVIWGQLHVSDPFYVASIHAPVLLFGYPVPTWFHPRCFLTRPAIGDVHASCGIGQHLKFVAGIQKEYSSSQQQPFGWIVLPAQVLDIGRLPLPLLQVSFEQSCMRTWQYHNQHLLMNVRCWHPSPIPSWTREVWWSSACHFG